MTTITRSPSLPDMKAEVTSVTARTFYRSPAFDSFGELLDWSERLGQHAPTVYAGPDQSFRGSVEVDGDRNGDAERDYDDEDCGKPASHRAGH